MTQSLALLAEELHSFMELERTKRIELGCEHSVLGTTGGRQSHIILHHLKEAKLLKAHLTLLQVVRREVHSSKE